MTILGIVPTALIVIFRFCLIKLYNEGYLKVKNKLYIQSNPLNMVWGI